MKFTNISKAGLGLSEGTMCPEPWIGEGNKNKEVFTDGAIKRLRVLC